MAEKRPQGPLGPMLYGKLPRLEADSGPRHSLAPSAANQDPCNYKGAYFCPMEGAAKAGPERLASWTRYPPLCPASMAGSPLREDSLLASCLLYRPPAGSSEKVQDSGPGELLPFSPQAHSYPCPPLAAPKPVYRSPLCYGLSACLGEGAAKRSLDVDWTLMAGPLLPPADAPCSLTLAPGKGQSLDGTFLRGVSVGGSGKDSSGSFSPCQAFLDKYQTVHSTGFLASKYAGPYSGDPKQSLSEGPPSPWTQLAQPLGPAYQDTVPSHYPLPPPAQALSCPPACHHPEKQSSYSSVPPLQPLGAHKGAGYLAGGLSSPYLRHQTAQTPCMPPVGLDTYSYPSVPLPAPSPGLKVEPPLAPRCPLDFAPQSLGFPYARDDLVLYGASPGLRGTPPSQNSVQAVPQPSAVQQACQPMSASQPCPEPVTEVRETQETMWLPSCRKEQLQPQLKEHPRAPIVIGDSPVPRTPPALPSCAQEHRSVLDSQGTLSPGSPPMPIIDNVFSLAPYRDYLDVQTPEAASEPDAAQPPKDSHDQDSRETPPAQEAPLRERCSLREEVALDLSVKKPMAEAPPVKVPSPAAHPELPVAVGVPGVGSTVSELPGLPVTTEAAPKTNFHSSVAFMFRKFKILRPAPLPAAMVPSVPTSVPASDQPAPTSTSMPIGLQILTQPLPVACFDLALPSSPAVSVATTASTVAPSHAPAQTPTPASTPVTVDSPEQYFAGLHESLCDAISGSVAHSPPEKLREWLETAGPWGQAAWQDGQAVQGLLDRLLSQLQRFVCTQQCPFPHVVRAGAIFVPIHLVKERLFPRLPPASVDHVLQEHRVELRPTTLSEERALRERALRGCTSRMLKLLALRQLPDIYPDLLGLQWRDCVRRQLGDFDTEAGYVPSSEPTMARDEPDSLSLAQKSPIPKARKLGRKPPTPGPEKAEATAGGESHGASPAPDASASLPSPTLRARCRRLLATAWLNGLALPTWGHKASGAALPSPRPQLLSGQSHHL
ncbi:uncharacterized protein C15orf39 homolog isoform X1 [Phyllostomus hastatus]|uniref:uncharacterized protein C15orf39 homolog isoform X1 n=1 Tax=Phyllostomus hastatus TaxID=9423 RepID=UPI001E681948|nr:uncharacterized protein C15orf39 homolog isoform X1 [Phyllostomus hastatus]XP_045704458.1 uncharacterized protein C15orf39 homolog isoform X1 [Phyllostomus hastatus]